MNLEPIKYSPNGKTTQEWYLVNPLEISTISTHSDTLFTVLKIYLIWCKTTDVLAGYPLHTEDISVKG